MDQRGILYNFFNNVLQLDCKKSTVITGITPLEHPRRAVSLKVNTDFTQDLIRHDTLIPATVQLISRHKMVHLWVLLPLLINTLRLNFHNTTQQLSEKLLCESHKKIKLNKILILWYKEHNADAVCLSLDHHFRTQEAMHDTFHKLANHYVI